MTLVEDWRPVFKKPWVEVGPLTARVHVGDSLTARNAVNELHTWTVLDVNRKTGVITTENGKFWPGYGVHISCPHPSDLD